jgi:hypothetical protein
MYSKNVLNINIQTAMSIPIVPSPRRTFMIFLEPQNLRIQITMVAMFQTPIIQFKIQHYRWNKYGFVHSKVMNQEIVNIMPVSAGSL